MMRMKILGMRWAFMVCVCIHFAISGQAVIFYSTGDPTYNTTAPTGALTNSGWQYQGQWGPYLGTVIAPRYFITARHVPYFGPTFHFAGQDYTVLTNYESPASDLRIWRVCGRFPFWANLYTNQNEAGLPLVVIGRGTQRGDPVMVNSALKGWLWGPNDSVQRWGQNVVSSVFDAGAGFGQLLQIDFDSNGGSNEVHLSDGDSGGGLFIQQAGVWKLAGINFSVDGPFNTTNNGSGFNAAIFDESGFYVENGGVWQFLRRPTPSAFYATRISANLAWIQSVLDQTPPADPPPVLQVSGVVTGPYLDASGGIVDTNAMTITFPFDGTTNQFFRLRGCTSTQITGITLSPPNIVFNYQ